MKCVIIAGGDLMLTDQITELIRQAQLIICADSGAAHLRHIGILPHLIIGDFDSLPAEDKKYFMDKAVEMAHFPPKKNETDSELCIAHAIERGATDITLLGAVGTRMDHTLANIFLLLNLSELKIPARIINTTNKIFLISGRNQLRLSGEPGDYLSLIPMSDQVFGVTLKGLQYPLVNATLKAASTLGISNQFSDCSAEVSIERGVLIVTQSKD